MDRSAPINRRRFLAAAITAGASFSLLACQQGAPTSATPTTSTQPFPATPAVTPAPTATPTIPSPTPASVAWGSVKYDGTCLWSSQYPDAKCHGTREKGYRLEVIRLVGDRMLVRDPAPPPLGGEALVDLDALALGPEARRLLQLMPVHETVCICVPSKSLFSEGDFAHIKTGVANWIEERFQPDYPGTKVYVQFGYPTDTTLVTIELESIPLPPTWSTPTPFPSPSPGPTRPLPPSPAPTCPLGFCRGVATATAAAVSTAVAAATATALATTAKEEEQRAREFTQSNERYAGELKQYNEQLGQMKAALDQQLRLFREVSLPDGPAGVDLDGAIKRSIERLHWAPVHKQLLVIADLAVATPPKLPPSTMSDMRVLLTAYCSAGAACEQRRTAWQQAIAAAGTTVRFFDPGDDVKNLLS
jgi:hypothetical protein